jgi:hypothetical protein
VKTSEANLEFSYDSQNRAEVARKTRNIVNIRATVLSNRECERRLIRKKKQSAATQLA